MKKRIACLILALSVLCTGIMLTACGNDGGKPKTEPTTIAEKSVAEVLNEALEKTGNLDSMAAVMKMEMNMAAEGITMSIPITANIKAKDIKGDNPVTSVLVTMSMFGEEMNIEMYQEGKWAYMVLGDMKYKMNAKDLGNEFNYSDSANDMLKVLPEDLLKDVELIKAEDGSQTATISISSEKFAEIYDELIDTVNSETGSETGTIKISDAVVKITVANGYVSIYDIVFTMDMDVDGTNTTTEVKTTLTYEKPGEAVTVIPPEGYQEFEEMDDDLM